jgi:capsular polysaccharide biosynthesis protein
MEHIKSHLDFSEAMTIVGVSGSALTGLAFCQRGTKPPQMGFKVLF